jgi:hypothetical protein
MPSTVVGGLMTTLSRRKGVFKTVGPPAGGLEVRSWNLEIGDEGRGRRIDDGGQNIEDRYIADCRRLEVRNGASGLKRYGFMQISKYPRVSR